MHFEGKKQVLILTDRPQLVAVACYFSYTVVSCRVYYLGPVLSQIRRFFQRESLDGTLIPFNFQLYNMFPVLLSAKLQCIHTL